MANQIGFSINIPDDIVQKAKSADEAISKLATTSETTADKMIDQFKKMANNGVQTLINKVEEAKKQLSKLGTESGFQKMVNDTKNAADSVVKLISVINNLSNASSASSKKNASDISTINKTYRDLISYEKQYQELVTKSKVLKAQGNTAGAEGLITSKAMKDMATAAHKLPETINAFKKRKDLSSESIRLIEQWEAKHSMVMKSILEDRAKRLNAVEQKRYEDWLKRKQEEQKENERIEKAKTKATQQAIKRQNKEFAAQAKANKLATEQQRSTMSGALKYSAEARSINEQIKAINYLKQARANLVKEQGKEKQYEENLKRINAEIRRQQTEVDKLTNKTKNSHRTLMNTAEQLKRAFAMMFSVSAIKGYVNQLISVRGEFEMQQRSLEILLKNKDKADELWDKTVKLAVKSPFTIKQLVTYTKQLAAYRIEHDKLYETNKMLADVSAGLGVDMSRLILAYGQVKAANFLRGTELRQFTEAGVNMLDELAKRFTKIEGRVVSAADVFDRISKRQVSFKDVEAVFQTITSEGGLFYQMQELQAETLKGQIMNLKDSLDLMFNDIGRASDGVLKSAVSLVRELVNNWRDFAPVLSFIIALIGQRLAVRGFGVLASFIGLSTTHLKAFSIWMTRGTAAMKAFNRQQQLATMTNPWMLLIQVVLALGVALWEATENGSKLASELGYIDSDVSKRLEDSISGYIKLADTIRDATKTTKEHEKAIQTLQQNYRDILPDYLLQVDYIKNMAKGYKEATDAIREHYNILSIDKKKAKIDELYGGDVVTRTVNLTNNLKDSIKRADIDHTAKDYLLSVIGSVVNEVVREVQTGTVEATSLSIKQAIRGKIVSLLGGGDFNFDIKYVTDLTEALSNYQKAIEGITGLPDQPILFTEKKDYDKQKQRADEFIAFFDKMIEHAKNGTPLNFEGFVAESGTLENLFIVDALKKLKEAAKEGEVAFSEAMPKIKREYLATVSEMVKGSVKGNAAVKNLGETIQTQATNSSLPEWANQIYSAMHELSKLNNVDLDVFKDIIPQTDQSMGDYAKVVKGKLDNISESIKKYKELASETLTATTHFFMSDILSTYNVSSIEELEQLETLFDKIYKLVGDAGKNNNNNKRDDTYSRRTKLVQDMRKAYEDLNKTFGKTATLEKILDSFSDEAKELGIAIKDLDVSTEEGFIKALESIEDLVKKDAKAFKEWKKAIREARLELDKTAATAEDERLKRQIDEMFSNYDLSIELEKMNIPPDLAKQLFNVDVFSLDDLKEEINKQTGGLFNIVVEMQSIENATGGNAGLLAANQQYQKLKALRDEYGADDVKTATDYAQKITEMEIKEMQERLKKYTEYLLKSRSESVNAKLEELRQLREIESLEGVSEPQKASMREGVRKETQEKIDKLEWEDFKKSPLYESLWTNLDTLGTKTIELLLNRLNQLKTSLKELPEEAYKEIQKQITELDELTMKRNPFRAVEQAFKDIKDLQDASAKITGADGKVQELKGEDALAYQLELWQQKQSQYKSEIDLLELIKQANGDINKLQELGILEQAKELGYLGKTAEELGGIISSRRELFNQATSSADSVALDLNKYQKARLALKLAQDETKAWGDSFSKVVNGLDSVLEAFGVADDNASRIGLQIADTMLSAVMNAISLKLQFKALELQAKALGTSMNAALGVVGWVAMAVEAAAMLFSAIFSSYDKTLERQIDSLKDKVENLERAYKKLEKAIESAYSSESLKKNYDAAIKNLQDRINATNKMISLEEKKKATDKDKLQEYTDQMNELLEEQAELLKEQVENLGGSYDIRSTTREFVDAWIDAFKETGNGLQGLKDNFKEFFKNILLEQAVMSGAGAIMQPLLDEINASLEDDFKIDSTEYDKIQNLSNEKMKQLDEFMNNMFGENGIYNKWITDTETGELSGLQKGIQGITEQTAEILESLLNSIRFFVAKNTDYLKIIADNATNNNSKVNPVLSELKAQTTLIMAIRDMFSGVIKSGHPTYGGSFIKVAL